MGGLTTPKGGATTTTTQKSEVPAYVQSAQQNLLNAANSVTSPFIQQSAFTTAPINADQSAAYDLTRSLAQNAFQTNSLIPAGRQFDAAAYLQANPDVAANGIDPWQHYQQYGKAEGRALPTTNFGPAQASLIDYRSQPGLNAGPAAQATAQGYSASTYDPATYNAATYQGEGYNAANAQASNVSGADISALLNPYTKDVVNTSLDTMRRQYDETSSANRLRSAASGSFGGSRQAIQQAALDRSFGEQVASTTASLMAAGYDKATATALSNAQMQQQAALSNQSAQNTAAQFGASARNSAAAGNAAAQNAAGQYNAGARNTAGQFNVGAQNTAAQFGATAQNNASQINAAAQNTRDQFNAGLNANLLQQANANALTQRGQDIGLLGTQQQISTAEQARQIQAMQALLGVGDAQRGIYQQNLNLPLQYLQTLAGTTPTNYGGTQTSTAPNTAPSPLQSLLGAGLSLAGKFI